jgi:hypothetical protein
VWLFRPLLREEDREKFEPVALQSDELCITENLSSEILKQVAEEQVVIRALVNYDSRLEDRSGDELISLMKDKSFRGGFETKTGAYCTEVTGEVIPVEIEALFADISFTPSTRRPGTSSPGTTTGGDDTALPPDLDGIEALAESDHPYENNISESYRVNNDSGKNAAQIHFKFIELEEGADKIEIRDDDGILIQEITESAPDGLWSDIIPATSIEIVLKTDGADQAWGFLVDEIKPVDYTTLAYSPHPYPNNFDDIIYIPNDKANPEGTAVRFDKIELEDEVDYIVIKDTNDVPYQWITGSHPKGLTSKVVPGAAVQVQLISDRSVQSWGYNIDSVLTKSPDEPVDVPDWMPDKSLVESDHPYASKTDQTWTITNPDVNAESSKIHFSRIDLANYYAVIEILDENDTVIQKITDGYFTDFWSDYVPGRIVKVKFTSNASSTAWGFRVDAIKTSVSNPGLAQSDHPYASKTDQTWTITNPDVNAESSKIHFSRIDLANYYAVIQILDENDTVIQKITDGYFTDFWSDYVPGRIVKVKFTSNASSTAWGFRVDAIKTSVSNPGLAQSDHPYASKTDQTWTITNPDVNAESSKIHFSRIDLANYYAVIQILDENDTVIQKITDGYFTDFWSDYVPGRIVKVKFTSNASSTAWGFRVDAIESK